MHPPFRFAAGEKLLFRYSQHKKGRCAYSVSAATSSPFQQMRIDLPLKESPAAGGAKALTAEGGEGDQLSICQEEIL